MEWERWGSLISTPSLMIAPCQMPAGCHRPASPSAGQTRTTLESHPSQQGFFDLLVPFPILVPLGSKRGERREKGEEKTLPGRTCSLGQQLILGCRSIQNRLHIMLVFFFSVEEGKGKRYQTSFWLFSLMASWSFYSAPFTPHKSIAKISVLRFLVYSERLCPISRFIL